jgi:hypothetical protein
MILIFLNNKFYNGKINIRHYKDQVLVNSKTIKLVSNLNVVHKLTVKFVNFNKKVSINEINFRYKLEN